MNPATDHAREVYHGMSRERLLAEVLREVYGWAPRELHLSYPEDEHEEAA